MTSLRLLADDLTGALDTAAQFVALTGPVTVQWGAAGLGPAGSFALDTGTREMTPDAAEQAVAGFAHLLVPGPEVIAFKKLDSLLRGHAGREIAACVGVMRPRHCVIAPAFPFQGRITRGGRQNIEGEGQWRPVGEDLVVSLSAAGFPVRVARPGDPLPEGVSLWDAETDADLASIAEAGRQANGPVLWCGTGGLAGALAGRPPPLIDRLPSPLLGLFGSDHPVTAGQLDAATSHFLPLADAGPASAAEIARRLRTHVASLLQFKLPSGLDRHLAARRIALQLKELVARLDPPGSLVVAGGETLRSLCLAIGATGLAVHGQVMPGIPVSTLCGGRWNGVTLVSKSGAFGDAGLLRQLVTLAVPPQERNGA